MRLAASSPASVRVLMSSYGYSGLALFLSSFLSSFLPSVAVGVGGGVPLATTRQYIVTLPPPSLERSKLTVNGRYSLLFCAFSRSLLTQASDRSFGGC